MRPHTRLPSSLCFAGAIGCLLIGCADHWPPTTTPAGEPARSVASIAQLRTELLAASGQVDNIEALLAQLASPPASDQDAAALADDLTRARAGIAPIHTRATDLRTRGDQYYKAWLAHAGDANDPTAAAARREQATKQYGQIASLLDRAASEQAALTPQLDSVTAHLKRHPANERELPSEELTAAATTTHQLASTLNIVTDELDRLALTFNPRSPHDPTPEANLATMKSHE